MSLYRNGVHASIVYKMDECIQNKRIPAISKIRRPHPSLTRKISPFWCPNVRPIDLKLCYSWWRHQMETFTALLAICAGNSPVPDEFSAQRPVTRSFYVFFDLRLNKRLSKQSWGWRFETLSRPLWRHSSVKHIHNSNNESIDHKLNSPSRGQSQNCQPDKTIHP